MLYNIEVINYKKDLKWDVKQNVWVWFITFYLELPRT